MSKLKWFSGGEDRAKEAIAIIADLLADLEKDEKNMPLQEVLSSYESELEKKSTSVSLVLSRMNMDISSTVRSNGIILSQNQSKKMKELSELSAIRYGY